MSDDPNIVVENELLRRGFTSIPNYLFGLPISSNAKLIYMALLSYAWNNRSCYPGLAKLCTDVSLSDKPVTKAIEELSNASLLEVKRRGQGKTNLYVLKDFNFTRQSPNGSESRIGESPNQESEILRIKNRSNSDTRNGDSPSPKPENRRIPLKRINKDTAEEISEETHAHEKGRVGGGVGVGSRFTLEECRKFAAHLHQTGQGITNPGGYATTVYRSGEADKLIEFFLSPPAGPEPPDPSGCPDCQGTGFWYPNGSGQGIAKCKHRRLQNDLLNSEVDSLTTRKLAPEMINEQAKVIAELIESGYTLDQAEAQFAAGMHADDWAAIRERAVSLKGELRGRPSHSEA